MPTPWRLWIDESGRFDTPDSAVCLGGVLVSPAHRSELERLDQTVAAYLPFLPRPLHARHLRSPLFVALCWQARGPASLTPEARRRLSATSRDAIASLGAGGTPTDADLLVAALELGGVPSERRWLRRDLVRLLSQVEDNPVLPTLQDLGWPAAVAAAVAALQGGHAKALAGLLAELREGTRPDVKLLDRLGRWLKRHHPAAWGPLQAGQRVVVSWVRRFVAVAGTAPGAVLPVVVAQAVPSGGGERYGELFDVLCRRALRSLAHAAGQGSTSGALHVAAARVSRPGRHGSYEPVWSAEELDQRAQHQALLPHTATMAAVSTPGYDTHPHMGLELADWVANCALRLVGSKSDLASLLAALDTCAGLPAVLDDLPLVAASQAPAAWLEATFAGSSNPPLASRGERAWGWQQAARWASVAGAQPAQPAGADHA